MIKIRDLRIKRKLTQNDLSLKLNVGQSTIAMWESGKNTPRAEMLPLLADALNCSIDDLFNTDENEFIRRDKK